MDDYDEDIQFQISVLIENNDLNCLMNIQNELKQHIEILKMKM